MAASKLHLQSQSFLFPFHFWLYFLSALCFLACLSSRFVKPLECKELETFFFAKLNDKNLKLVIFEQWLSGLVKF